MAGLNNGEPSLHSQHLTCFDGGNFILGGQVLNNQEYLDAGLKLVEGCRATYAATATHIGPETFGWGEDDVPEDQADFYAENGFFIEGSTYNLRPEVVESYYYAFRATGDEKVCS
jgi:mannosyl-oligosaccharide alpha-1,2-mannosidase